jgi:hypothetical protein
MLIFYHVTSCYRNTKCGNTTKTKLIKKKYQRAQLGKLLKHLNVFITEKSEDFFARTTHQSVKCTRIRRD